MSWKHVAKRGRQVASGEPWVIQGLLRQHLVEFCHLSADPLELNDQAPKHGTLFIRQWQAIQPFASSLAEEVASPAPYG